MKIKVEVKEIEMKRIIYRSNNNNNIDKPCETCQKEKTHTKKSAIKRILIKSNIPS